MGWLQATFDKFWAIFIDIEKNSLFFCPGSFTSPPYGHAQRSKFDDNNSVSSKSSLFVPELQVNSVCLIEGKEIEVEEQKKQKELAPESKIKTNRLQAINMMTAISCSSLTPSLVSLSKSIVWMHWWKKGKPLKTQNRMKSFLFSFFCSQNIFKLISLRYVNDLSASLSKFWKIKEESLEFSIFSQIKIKSHHFSPKGSRWLLKSTFKITLILSWGIIKIKNIGINYFFIILSLIFRL